MNQSALAKRLSSLYELRSLRGYVRWKVRFDPVYAAAAEALRGNDRPLIDLGCGVGVLPFYLRESGFTAPIIGIDFDDRKIDAARRAAQRYRGIDFIRGDVRDPLPEGHNVVANDILQYLKRDAQDRVLANIRRAIPEGGVAVFRQGLRDGSWRYRWQAAVDELARKFRWMRGEALTYPSREEVLAQFDGFAHEVSPLWGNMPYNNWLFVMRRATARRPE